MGRDSGLTSDKILQMDRYPESDLFSEIETLCLKYADHMTDTPAEIPEALFDRLRELFHNEQLVELTSTIAWENYRARFNHAFGAESEGYSDGAVCPLTVGPSA